AARADDVAATPTGAESAPAASNLVVLATGEVVDGETGEVHGASTPREPGAGQRPTGRAGLGDLLG
ncbi:hypothetical protein, partial [Burkholderia cenocepacia]